MENKEKIFPEGMIYRGKREGSPDWVKGAISINGNQFFTWLKGQKAHMSEKGWFTIDIKESKGGKIYCELNTWKPTKPETNSDGSPLPVF